MNLASIPEETEEELEDDDASDEGEGQGVGDGEGGERRWGENWVFKGALSPYDNCGRRRVGNDMDKPLYMMVPNPEDNYVPKVGNRQGCVDLSLFHYYGQFFFFLLLSSFFSFIYFFFFFSFIFFYFKYFYYIYMFYNLFIFSIFVYLVKNSARYLNLETGKDM